MKHLLLTFIFLSGSILLFGQEEDLIVKSGTELHWDSINTLVETAFYKGDYPTAVVFAKEAYDWAIQNFEPDDLLIATSLDNLGTVLHHARQLQEAIPYLEEAVSRADQQLGKTHLDYISRASNLAMLYKDVGAFHKSLPLFTEVLDITRVNYGKKHPYYNVLLNNQSILFQSMGRYEEALTNALEALELTEQTLGKKHSKYGIRLTSLGNIYKRLGQYEESFSCLTQALELIKQQKGKDHPSVAKILRILADAYLESGHPQDAINYLERTLAIEAEKIGTQHHNYLLALISLAEAHQQLGHHEKALLLYKEVVAKRENNLNTKLSHRLTVVPYTRLATQYEYMNNLDASYENHLIALKNQKERRKHYPFFTESEQLSLNKGSKKINDFVQSFLYRNQENQYDLTPVLNNILETNGFTLSNTQQMLTTLRSNPNEVFSREFEAWENTKTLIAQQYSLTTNDRKLNIDSLEKKANTLESDLAKNSITFRQLNQHINWKDIRNHLSDGEVAIAFSSFNYIENYQITDSVFYVAYVIKKEFDTVKMIHLCEESDFGSTKKTRSLYAMSNGQQRQNLHQLIYAPLQEILNDVHTIHYTSAGILHRVNLNAIPIDDQNTLSDQFEMHQLSHLKQISNKPIDSYSTNKQALLFGGIDYEEITIDTNSLHTSQQANNSVLIGSAFRSLRSNDWPFLEWTRNEVEKAEEILKAANFETVTITRQQATEEKFKQINQHHSSPRVLHFATHAYFFPSSENIQINQNAFESSRHPMIRSGLILAGANKAWRNENRAQGEDGILTAYEIAQMDLSNTELVVLSACDTGLGDIDDNEGVLGLQRAFKIAGVQNIIMSLWSVKDQQTQEFMIDFYRIWLNPDDKKTIPQAFQQAQQNLHQRYAKPFNPFLWAGFILLE